MKKVNLNKQAIVLWKKGKTYKGFHPTGYNEIKWSTISKLEKMAFVDSTKCCATGTCDPDK
ncbi:hypothetical protein HRbin35_00009 [bacterium HR35]|nr:hypothetical protein HRbin35_00009 [bacterium HR35]